MIRNSIIENRIEQIRINDNALKMNSYGGMGLDGLDENTKRLRYEELDYIRNHPEIYKKPKVKCDPSMYLIKLN